MLVPWFAGSPLPLCCPMGSPEGVGWAEELVAKFLGSAAFPDPSSSGSEPFRTNVDLAAVGVVFG